ncbi:MAG: pre-peptidase C-terminal domain-containing protein [Burkholderiaceae bacterium]|nr:pre-peptidase C-terminal domain-containing protein [Burkholderiaceae bacterium]
MILQGALFCGATVMSQLSLAACLAVETEPNNSDTQANTGLCSGTAVTGAIASSSDVDWYKIVVTTPGVIDIRLSHDTGIDLDWYLYKETGSYVTYRSTNSNPETGTYSAAAGTYYIRVKSYSGAGRYTLNATFPQGTVPPDGTSVACTLPAGVNLGKTGNAVPKATTTSGGVVLMGGGPDVDEAIKWMNTKSGGGDFVVLRSTGTNGYNDYIYGLGGVNSVQTLLITSTAQANDACVVQTIKAAGAVFLAGGNQADYINYFKGQGVGNALNYLINTKRAPVGGTSAGMAIQGQYYHPGGAADDTTVLTKPTTIAIGNNFLTNSVLNNVVTDTHFAQRNRQPRLTTFLASSIYNFGAPWAGIRGISADEGTAVTIDTAGAARIYGSGNINFVSASGAPETLAPNSALTWYLNRQALRVYQVPGTATGTGTFNLSTWSGTGGTTHYWYVSNGTMTIN